MGWKLKLDLNLCSQDLQGVMSTYFFMEKQMLNLIETLMNV